MKKSYTIFLTRAVGAAALSVTLAVAAFAQQPAATTTADAEQVRTMKMKYAAARAKVQTDPEYQAAVKRAEEARRAAESLFFAKMRRADPELKDYLDRLEGKQASPTGAPVAR